jgi:regulatory protein
MSDRRARDRHGEDGRPESGERADAWQTALKYLAARARTTHEVRQALAGRGYPPDDIATVIARLVAARYLDDADFARTWVIARARRGAAGPARLARELRAKGIPEAQIKAALRALEAEWDASAATDEAAQRKLKSLEGLPTAVARRRLAAYLERRGFARDVSIATCRRYVGDADDAA